MPNALHRDRLPQLGGEPFLMEAGLETDLIFNHGIDLPQFAAHTALAHDEGRAAVTAIQSGFLELARDMGFGLVMDVQTWRAGPIWGEALGQSEAELKRANEDAVAFAAGLRAAYAPHRRPVVLAAAIGPCGDAYEAAADLSAQEAEDYHATQLGWLAATEVDMAAAITFTEAKEATGFVRAAGRVGLPAVVSFTVETDGALPSGQALSDAIEEVDRGTDAAAAYFMVNCAHPDHFSEKLVASPWAMRIRGVRGNASRLSHAELDASETLDDGDPQEFGALTLAIRDRLPWVNVFGGCCGCDLRHVAEVARGLAA